MLINAVHLFVVTAVAVHCTLFNQGALRKPTASCLQPGRSASALAPQAAIAAPDIVDAHHPELEALEVEEEDFDSRRRFRPRRFC